ncbi:LysR family transcriptional regulator [Marinobacterium sp. D7]|uniref:LysR family transcriptional regulator n=1 Tax=Marinobacterium ramblicola TaxID=2849041 RepID=UPI001C2CFD05|nr:LysR family transcriptional regulator [Marinobacterium ramblicola]MBV1789039.1 LysR family transcriptional regulator [Marinobacterium ramblicola]
MLNELKLFVITVEEGSLTAAAERLSTTVATVSRRINALEEHLGCKLLHRSPRGLTLTREGQIYFDECAEFVHSLDQRLDNLNATLNSLAGPLKILAPTNFAVGPLDQFWEAFIQRYPQIEVSIELSNDVVDMLHAQADIAIRIGPQPSSSLIQKKLGYVRTILVASPDLLAKTTPPASVDDLRHYPSVSSHLLGQWELSNRLNDKVSIQKQHQYVSTDLQMMINIVKSQGGIALMPISTVYRELELQQLVRVLPDWEGQERHLYLVWPNRRALSVRAKTFASLLEEYLRQQEWCQTN